MNEHLETIDILINALKAFPGIGTRQATRMAYDILRMDDEQVDSIIHSLKEVKEKIHPCPRCGLYCEGDVCHICSDPDRDHETMLIITDPKDSLPFEKNETFHGIYFVLGTSLSLSQGRTVEDLHLDKLFARIEEESVKEIIIATEPTVAGETTALYIANSLKDKNVKVSRLAYGLPMGSSIDYADSLTLDRALKGRTKIE